METLSQSKRRVVPFTTLDIVLMAMLATANAVLTFYLSYINKMLNSLGGPVATSTIVGVYMVYGLLAYYIIRKPGTAAITYGIGGAIQCFVGNTYGIAASIVAALCYLVVAEAVFFLLRYKRWNAGAMMLVGGAMVPIWFICAANMFGYTSWSFQVLAVTMVVRIISGIVLCGLLTKVLGDMLQRSGLLKRFAIGRKASADAGNFH
ncbi:energy-coupling factor transport system substrate-specific component [Paenibacillus rhizosphaerae]|uniref:Energy-coupling factor transport system substrate-specific component n=1 Tax=Paenibacillus rhizosphaerae TaxID=297318 RepID=A0A839TU94_9BACL|nr:ECF transporter S component [Paenibacillus rhizosphaerae]MBB3130396.1 energy-coupling factor transport system substrate-specific component [Paenibacillus rhizosphaerae]